MSVAELSGELVKTYGTPLYVYDGDLVLRRRAELAGYLGGQHVKVLYAMKANSNIHLLRLLAAAGGDVETVSLGEVELALAAGFSAERILYTGNNISDSEMLAVAGHQVLLNLGSLSELRRYGELCPGSRLCLRFNPDVVAGEYVGIQTGGALTKFGLLLQDLGAVLGLLATHRLTVVGLHEHTGSGIQEASQVLAGMRALISIATPANFPALQFLDFGGGFKVPYRPTEARIDYEALGAAIAAEFAAFTQAYGRQLTMYFEPGKFLVAEAGTLLLTVTTLKDNRGRLIAGTDSGFPQLIRPMFYGAYHHIRNLSNPNGVVKKYDVCGNICETGDNFATDRDIAEIREGDILAIETAGAYCYSMGGLYNFRPMPAEVMIQGGSHRLIRRRLTPKELVAQMLSETT